MSTTIEPISSDQGRSPAAQARSPEERVAGAMQGFSREIGAMSAFRLESCIHCGMCADACHYYIATEDPQYTPIWKVEPFKQAYKREAGAFAPVFRWLGLKRAVTAEQLTQWQHLLFDSCNLCGRCSLICPMGIDVTELIEQARHAMFDAGLAPAELYEKAAHQRLTGQPETSVEPYRDQLISIGARYQVAMPLDQTGVDLMVCVPRTDIVQYPAAVAALARVMTFLNISFTFRSDALVAENYGHYAGSREWQRDISLRLIEQAIACGAKTLLIPECGHAYAVLRWEAADLYGAPLPFEVMAVSEYLAKELKAGRLKLDAALRADVTFQDPCQLTRKGGVQEAPRTLLRAMGVEIKEMQDHGMFSFCCGGGGGVVDIDSAAPLRYRTMETKLREIAATGATTLLTSCSDCRRTFDDANRHFADHSPPGSRSLSGPAGDAPAASLLELIAQHLHLETPI